MRSTMQDAPLTLTSLFLHGQRVHARSTVVTYDAQGPRRRSFGEVAERAERLAAALARLGVGAGDRVGTLMWNNAEHMEAYMAIPCMGAVLHTLNLRLFPEQLRYVIDHAQDRVVIVDASLVPLLAPHLDHLPGVEHVIVVGDDAEHPLPGALRYEDLLAAEEPGYDWPDLDERSAAAMCYTSGTTGDPKGVVYSHRSMYVHAFAQWGINRLTDTDRLLAIVPMFHVNAWGLPYTGWFVGLDFVMPDAHLQPDALSRMITEERVTFSVGVPTVWNGILQHAEDHDVDFSSIREVIVGGAAVPRTLMERFAEEHGVRIVQAWGMTETSPLGAVAQPPKDVDPAEEMAYRTKTGRIAPGVELRIVDAEGAVQPWDGASVGEIQVRGPWITGSYYLDDAPEKFSDGWLRTGDVGHVDERGYVQITDRTKDVIKSGGEWISSIQLEDAIMAHPAVVEAAVVAVPDARWDERPLACVVLRPDASVEVAELQEFVRERVARWWVPERWSFLSELPKTSVGKFDKKRLRGSVADGELELTEP